MQPLVLIIASIFIKAFSIWQRLQTSNSSNETKKNETNKQNSLNKVSKALRLANICFLTVILNIPVLLNRSKNSTSEVLLQKCYGHTYLEY